MRYPSVLQYSSKHWPKVAEGKNFAQTVSGKNYATQLLLAAQLLSLLLFSKLRNGMGNGGRSSKISHAFKPIVFFRQGTFAICLLMTWPRKTVVVLHTVIALVDISYFKSSHGIFMLLPIQILALLKVGHHHQELWWHHSSMSSRRNLILRTR